MLPPYPDSLPLSPVSGPDARVAPRRRPTAAITTPKGAVIAVSPVDLQKALAGADYPATKRQLLVRTARNNAGDDVTSALDALPNREFPSPAALSAAVADATR